jgi:thiosulfate/3-mercaptopyruvate sulfurtransferase
MNLITCDWLNENLNQKDLCIIDCTWHLPGTNRDGKSEFLNERIPGSIFFDLDEFSDQSSKYPHTLADKEWFSKKASELGIQNSDHIICYDTLGIFTSPRVSWMFSQYGHEKVSILDGGFKNWKIKKFKIETGKPQNKGQSNYIAKNNPKNIKFFEDIKNNIVSSTFKLIDARPSGRFNATDPEPRPELQSGNIPNSQNLPFSKLLDPATGCMKNKDELKKIFDELSISSEDKITFSCGSGVAAVIAGTAYEKVFNKEFDVYDGSWTEWALKNKLIK